MDPLLSSTANNKVVKETMVRTLNVGKETGQDYGVVTYDLAVAKKEYAIQSVEASLFDKLLIMHGSFHLELALVGAIGSFINEELN